MPLTTKPADARAEQVGPPPPFDPECGAVLAPLAELISPSMTIDMIPARRAMAGATRPSDDDLRCGGVFTVEERSVPGPGGAPDISLLICRPTSATAPVPAVYNVHGGGMVMGDNRSGVLEALDWAQELELAVVSVEYRLAPETPHPGPVEDCYAGLIWTVEHADELGIDPTRILIAGGVPAVAWPPASRFSRATGVARCSSGRC